MPKPKRPNKPRVKKIVLVPGEVVSVTIPKDHTPLVAALPEERRVEIVPVKKKKGWWETLLYGDDQ